MWMNTELTDDHKKYIYEKYPNIRELHCYIKEFRKYIQETKSSFVIFIRREI